MNSSLGFSFFEPSPPSATEIAQQQRHGQLLQQHIERAAAARGLVKARSLNIRRQQYFIHPPTYGVFYVESDADTLEFIATNSGAEEILRLNGYK